MQWRDDPKELDNGNKAILSLGNELMKLCDYGRFKEKTIFEKKVRQATTFVSNLINTK